MNSRVGVAMVAAAAILGKGVEIEAQNRAGAGVWERAASDRGWIGVSFNVSADEGGLRETILITDVSAGSPAAEAGLRAGDRVVAINDLDTPRELASLPELLRLTVGDPVVMVIERNGDRTRFRMRAASRPAGFAPSRRVEVTMQSDSLVETWSRSMDSLRIHLRAGDDAPEVRIREVRGPQGSVRRMVIAGEGDTRVRAPFEFFIFQGEEHDSLRTEMVEINTVVVDLEEQIRSREQELRQRLGSRSDPRLDDDPQLRRLAQQLDRLSTRTGELEAAMAEAARETAGLQYDVVDSNQRSTRRDNWSAGDFRPLTPYLLGRNLVAGAEVIDLEPELARYFEVSGGILVTRVTPGTPAALAGLVPGDVITRMDQVGVRSVEDLRYGVSVAGDALPLTLIREGESRQVLLRKR
ncbi:MAG: PDZ domain-containing protein [Gemmatimonadetes bacterium]|nr:PDZ domain-containing protein [Gemmatimonadota bacterium]NNF12000.1 PDZ domain-containing protein [Gemmatimonadota bacterium]NNL30362.1 PDZ domain-containing protein [Gemmatimonadota bacterium]